METLIIWRGIERLMIVAAATVFGILGYKLYDRGISRGRVVANVDSPILKFALSGTGPGLIFMAFGAVILVMAIVKSGETTRTVHHGHGGSVDGADWHDPWEHYEETEPAAGAVVRDEYREGANN